MANYFSHPTAVIDPGARIGADTKVWHFSHVMGTAHIGDRCILGQNVFVASNVQIGNQVKIQNNVSIYEGVTLEDDVFCGPSMVFTNVKNPRSARPRNKPEDFLQTRVCRGASIGANATIVCGVTLGQWCFVAAGSVVTKNVAPYAVVVGVPARRVSWMCECGDNLTFKDSLAVCMECGLKFRQLSADQVEKV